MRSGGRFLLALVTLVSPAFADDAPFFAKTERSYRAKVAVPFEVAITAQSPRRKQSVSVSNTPLPDGAQLIHVEGKNPTRYVLRWTPRPADAGKSATVCFSARDAAGRTSIGNFCLDIAVAPPPAATLTFASPSNAQPIPARVGTEVGFRVVVSDPAPEAMVSVEHTPLPEGATLVRADLRVFTFAWTPTAADAGKTTDICLQARDDEGRTSVGSYCFQLAVAP